MPPRSPAPLPGSRRRALVATAEIVGLGAWAHAAADGALPGPGLVLALAVVVGGVSLALRRRLLTTPVAAGLAVVAQLVLHTVSSHAGGHGTHHAAGALAGTDLEMLAAHAASAVVTVLALRWQEQLVEVLAQGLRVPALRGLPLGDRRGLRPTRARMLPAGGLRVLALAPRRGPPRAA